MNRSKWILAVSILLFAAFVSMPAFAAKPWPTGNCKKQPELCEEGQKNRGPADKIEAYEELGPDGEEGTVDDGTPFTSLVNNPHCHGTEDNMANFHYDGVQNALAGLGYTQRPKDDLSDADNYEGDVKYPLPITYEPQVETPFKDFAGLAHEDYFGMFDYEKGDHASALQNILKIKNSFINGTLNDPILADDGVTIIGYENFQDGKIKAGSISLQDAWDAFLALENCID